MPDIMQQIQQLQDYYDTNTKLHDKLLSSFKLSGYDMNTPESDDGKSRPKTLEELVDEVLRDPPAEPEKWIRISQIPQYVSDYLIVPDRQEIDNFNASRKSPLPKAGSDKTDEPTIEPTIYDDPSKTFNDKGELDPDHERTGKSWSHASKVPVGTWIVDSIGTTLYKYGPKQWLDPSDHDEYNPEYLDDKSVTGGAPLEELRFKDES